jgi:inositol-hexakisphosphate kinase
MVSLVAKYPFFALFICLIILAFSLSILPGLANLSSVQLGFSRPEFLTALALVLTAPLGPKYDRQPTTFPTMYPASQGTDNPPESSHLIGDSKNSKQHYYRFPLSPPSSGTVTAISSPRLSTITPNDPEVVEKLLATSSALCQNFTLAPNTSWRRQPANTATDSDGYLTEKSSQPQPSRTRPRKAANRALTLPTGSTPLELTAGSSPPKTARQYPRRSSSTCSSSSSSSPTSPELVPSQPSAGIGRKVAATLQLFKETAGAPEEAKPGEPSTRPETSASGIRRTGSFSQPEDVAEAQFEFVKRSEWPEREAAAVRRERSSTNLERVKTRESIREDEPRLKDRISSTRDSGITDLTQWRKEVVTRQERQDNSRGRRRERTVDEGVAENVRSEVPLSVSSSFHEPPSPFIRPRSRAYPPSPSPSRSPATRNASYVYNDEASDVPAVHSRPSLPDLSITQTTSHHSRSPTPIQSQSPFPAYTSRPDSPQESTSFSPWSTDDESTWETASATTSTSTTSAHTPFRFPSSHDTDYPSFLDPPEDQKHLPLLYAAGDNGHIGSRFENPEKGSALQLHSHDNLPHIPLRPFRNQVGGHSAIYKFTKQAVCKVCQVQPLSLYRTYIITLYSFPSLSYRERTFFMNRWNGRRPHFLDLFHDI